MNQARGMMPQKLRVCFISTGRIEASMHNDAVHCDKVHIDLKTYP